MPTLSAEGVIRAQQTVTDIAHAAGWKIYGVTYPPFAGTRWYTEEGEAVRIAVNTWIRDSGAFDAGADFHQVLGHPANPSQRRPEFMWGSPDVFNDDAFRAMANSFDLSVF